MNLLELCDLAEQNDIDIFYRETKVSPAFSMPECIVMDTNQLDTLAEVRTCLAHELGHELYAGFYTVHSGLETRERIEARATRWAVDALIPVEELLAAMKDGKTEAYQLAEHFDVTEDFVREAVRIHQVRGDLGEYN